MERIFFALGSILAGLSVVAGAYAAHGTTSVVGAEQIVWINKAARYQMYHALALLVVSFAIVTWPEKASINLGYMTPAGGFAFIGAWLVMAYAGCQKK